MSKAHEYQGGLFGPFPLGELGAGGWQSAAEAFEAATGFWAHRIRQIVQSRLGPIWLWRQKYVAKLGCPGKCKLGLQPAFCGGLMFTHTHLNKPKRPSCTQQKTPTRLWWSKIWYPNKWVPAALVYSKA